MDYCAMIVPATQMCGAMHHRPSTYRSRGDNAGCSSSKLERSVSFFKADYMFAVRNTEVYNHRDDITCHPTCAWLAW